MSGFLKTLFGSSTPQYLACPFCLTRQSLRQTPGRYFCTYQECAKEIPLAYVREIQQVEPISVHAVGFTYHGKSVYLSSLIDHLELMAYLWNGGNLRNLNQSSLDYVREHRRMISQGDLPVPTSPDFPVPVIMHLKGMAKWQNKCLVMYDTAGENFAKIETTSSNGRFVAHAQTSLFLVSLKDLPDTPGFRISDLFDVYLATLDQLGSTVAGRNVIVVYTKADLFWERLPDAVSRYLLADNLWESIRQFKRLGLSDADMRQYVQHMRDISDALRDFTIQSVESGLNLINSAQERQINLQFAVNSALGSAPGSDNRLTAPPSPRRVLDPFFWTLELSRS